MTKLISVLTVDNGYLVADDTIEIYLPTANDVAVKIKAMMLRFEEAKHKAAIAAVVTDDETTH